MFVIMSLFLKIFHFVLFRFPWLQEAEVLERTVDLRDISDLSSQFRRANLIYHFTVLSSNMPLKVRG